MNGQAAYDTWAEVMAANGVTCEPFEALGNVEQMAWREVARQPQAVPGDLPAVLGSLAAFWVREYVTADGWPDVCAKQLLDVLAGAVPPPADDVKPAPELAALADELEAEASRLSPPGDPLDLAGHVRAEALRAAAAVIREQAGVTS